MSIKIGDGNKIKNSTIIDNSNSKLEKVSKETFANRHPILFSIICSIISSIIMMFTFWDTIDKFIKSLF